MKKIIWCKKQEKGIRIVEPNDNLSEEYIKRATSDLGTMGSATGIWKTIIAYYACYNALYSLLTKAGIKCEIHDCSIELMDYLGFDEHDKQFMQELKKGRIENQYYLKHNELKDENEIKKFVFKCKQLLKTVDFEKALAEIKRDLDEK